MSNDDVSFEKGPGQLKRSGAFWPFYVPYSRANAVHSPEGLANREQMFELFCDAIDNEERRIGGLAVSECRPYHLVDFVDGQPGWRSSDPTRRAMPA